MSSQELSGVAEEAIAYARREIAEFGLPHPVAFDLSLEKGRFLAEKLCARQYLVDIGVALMDIKLGQAFKEKRLADHVRMSVDAASAFLSERSICESDKSIIINSVRAHHGTVPFEAVEAEICANADCYRFIHPKGVLLYLTVLGKRLGSFAECIDQAEAKLDEKWPIVSLAPVKEELGPIYRTFKDYFAMSRR